MDTIEKAILYYCQYQERCHADVRNKLYELGCTTPQVEEYIADLIGKNIINEERYACAFARGKYRMKQWGREKIRQHLKLKKISDYCIKKGLTEIDPVSYEETLNKLAVKKWAELKSEKNVFTKKGKAYKYLIQKGYERDMIKDAIVALVDIKRK